MVHDRGASQGSEYSFRYDPDDDRSLSTTVVEAVAWVRDVDPVELDPLAHVLDPDALDRLLTGGPHRRRQRSEADRPPDPGIHVGFEYEGCAVTVLGSGEFTVERRTT